ncbi:MAG: homocysteine S-methyltransferase family protein [Rhodobacteraceae bacterium]|nr:homocysteine S-methyltransferase family protein [Paracoccaceae bacterium]
MFTLLDGGLGRELQRIGAPFSQPLWSAQALLERPDYVSKAHQHFIDAGCDVITVNSYSCVPFHLGQELYEQQGRALVAKAAGIARECAKTNPNVEVAGCIPPVLGSYRPDLFDAQKALPIVEMLVAEQTPYVDFWLAETLSCLEEFELIHQVVAKTGKKSLYSFTLLEHEDAPTALRSGVSVKDAARAVFQSNAAGISFNCSGPEVMLQAVLDAREVMGELGVERDIGVYANAFTPISEGHRANNTLTGVRTDMSPQAYEYHVREWIAAGATIVGGCCGIFPEHIRMLDQLRHEVAA